jgi:hypothetical protein
MMHQSLDPGENRHCEAGDSGNSESSVEATSPTHQVSMPWVRWVVMAQISGCSLGASASAAVQNAWAPRSRPVAAAQGWEQAALGW